MAPGELTDRAAQRHASNLYIFLQLFFGNYFLLLTLIDLQASMMDHYNKYSENSMAIDKMATTGIEVSRRLMARKYSTLLLLILTLRFKL